MSDDTGAGHIGAVTLTTDACSKVVHIGAGALAFNTRGTHQLGDGLLGETQT